MIEGRLQTRNWLDQNNNKRYITEIIADNLQLGPRQYGESGGNQISDVKKEQPAASAKSDDADIPIIDENEPMNSGVEESEVKIKEEDLPF